MPNEPDTPKERSPESSAGFEVSQRTVVIPFPESFLYANCAAFAIGQNEIRLGFAEALQDGKAVSKVGIVMPPETAAVIALILFKQVQIFEQNFGEIRHPMWKALKAGEDPSASPFAPFGPRSEGRTKEKPTEEKPRE